MSDVTINKVSESEFLNACLAYKRQTGGRKAVIGLRISKAVLEAFAKYFEVSPYEALTRIDQTVHNDGWDVVLGKDGHAATIYRPGERVTKGSILVGVLALIQR